MSMDMSNSKVDTLSRLAQWKIETLNQGLDYCSNVFRIGIWIWHFRVMASFSQGSMLNWHIYLSMDNCLCSDKLRPETKFVFRVSNFGQGRQLHVSPVFEKLFKKGQEFVWAIPPLSGKVVINVEFLELKKSTFHGEEKSSSFEYMMHKSLQKSLSHILREKICTDVRINVSGGTLHAHKFILAGRSTVFQSMFEQSSIMEILDMSLESCNALLEYLYGVLEQEDVLKHRHALLSAADRYDISDLREHCEKSLLEDITTDNVLERLRDSWLYRLQNLKMGCFRFLFGFEKINEIRDDVSSFLRQIEKDHVVELFDEMLLAGFRDVLLEAWMT